MHGRAELGFVHVDGADRLAHLYQRAPLRVLFPDPPADEPPQAALVTTSGGLAGGDVLELSVHAAPRPALWWWAAPPRRSIAPPAPTR